MSLVTRLRTPAGGKSGFSRGGGREEEGGLNGGTQRVADGWPEGRRKWVVSPATTATFPPFSSAHTRSAVPSLLLARKSGRGGKRKLEVEADFVEASLRDCSSPIFRSLLALFRIQIQ